MKILERLLELENAAEFIGVICGLGILGYIGTTWVLALWSLGSYAIAVTASIAGAALALLALVRIPIALIIVFGAAAISIVAFLAGQLGILLP
ncbi:hypothetical protein [Duganella sp. FT27W]|uniref:hypothetical protein n=1 Tax=Duganella sp. FT27W TaxID=2654636 RepID=UPI00128C1BAE|nr:hypothetical protein [Duganella sp. FT27W]MPQ55915.1 hypothetical protein [Duganella sp. FT27W]